MRAAVKIGFIFYGPIYIKIEEHLFFFVYSGLYWSLADRLFLTLQNLIPLRNLKIIMGVRN